MIWVMGRGKIYFDLLWEEDRPNLEQKEEYLKAATIDQMSSTGRPGIGTRDRTG